MSWVTLKAECSSWNSRVHARAREHEKVWLLLDSRVEVGVAKVMVNLGRGQVLEALYTM